MDKAIYASQLNKLRRYCAYQERCHQELRRKSFQIGLSDRDTHEALTVLKEEGFLNEARFAMLWVGSKMRIKKWGPQKIEQGLKLRGIPTYLIAQAMAQYDNNTEQQYMDEWIMYKSERLPNTLNACQRQLKLVRFLLQKGFSNTSIEKALQ